MTTIENCIIRSKIEFSTQNNQLKTQQKVQSEYQQELLGEITKSLSISA
jgi:hypothetical protein